MITWSNKRGDLLLDDPSSIYRVVRITGLSSPDADLQMQSAPYQDGATFIGANFETRDVSLLFSFDGISPQHVQECRRQISRVFNPKDGMGELTLVDQNKTILAVPRKVIYNDDSHNLWPNRQRVLVEFECPNPFLLDNYISGEQMAYLMGGLKFPLVLPTQFAHRGYQRTFTNVGDVPTPVEIEFKGPAQNPTIYNRTTGEYITVNRELGADDILLINTAFGQKRVEIQRANGESENAFNYIDLASSFFQLELGDNLIEYSSNNDSTLTRVRVIYRNRYVGI
ncbi:phage tail family protein [Halalkalibacter oceani]|uniref:phage tail family protein n=1 Tax=Halalkalibacter oceani TaxID=1653776 RepID=UPI0033975420